MILVLYRRMKDIYLHLVFQEQNAELLKKNRLQKGELERLSLVAADAMTTSAGPTTAAKVETPVVKEVKLDETSEGIELTEGPRKRAGKGETAKSE
ncbi:hypothetical protein HDV00_004600 [Rhizophlyctis rosea]|nr:hypothetical protein HDV00_004600 [Rhizophlyctis rosea]